MAPRDLRQTTPPCSLRATSAGVGPNGVELDVHNGAPAATRNAVSNAKRDSPANRPMPTAATPCRGRLREIADAPRREPQPSTIPPQLR